jgi:SAM-dependent methyltransferase
VGEVAETDLLTTSRVSRRHVVGLQPGVSSDLQATSWALPFKTDTIDVVILPHTLDFTPYPHQVLREVERILIPEGHVVITGFNPLSLWQLWRWSLGWRRQPPWCGHFFGQFRLRDWLTLLGFDVTHKQYFFYRPPVRNARLMQRLGFMEKLGQRLWPIAGAGYMLVARKRVETLTPIRQKWSTRKKVVSSGLVESRLSHQERKEAVSD